MTVSQCYVNQHTVSAEDLWDICRGKKAPYWSLKTLYVSLQTGTVVPALSAVSPQHLHMLGFFSQEVMLTNLCINTIEMYSFLGSQIG